MQGKVMADQRCVARGVKGHTNGAERSGAERNGMPSRLGLRGGLARRAGSPDGTGPLHNQRGPRDAAFKLKPLALSAHPSTA
jgi:hypothetical protein